MMLNTFYNWWNHTSGTSTTTSANTHVQPTQLTEQQAALVTQIFKAPSSSNCISIEWKWKVTNQAGAGHATTFFFKFPSETTFLEVFEDNISLNTASWYGTPTWNNCIWFSAMQKSVNGLLSITKSNPKESNFYPFESMPSECIPTLIPACSKLGKDGYACVFEDGITEFGVSLWDISAKPPKQLFRQAGFLATHFMDNRFLLSINANNQLACWDLEARHLRYSIEGWIETSEILPYFGPYFPKQNMLFASNGSWIYAFNLSERLLAYKFKLPVISGVGVFQMIFVDDQHVFFREFSCGRVFIYEVSSGKQCASFQIGGGIDYIDPDDFPFCIYNGLIAALAQDRKTVCFYDPASGKLTKTFGQTSADITGLHCTDKRLIASCYCTTEVVPKGYQDQVYLWDITTGQEVKVITPPDDYGIVPQDITNGLLTLYLYPALKPKIRTLEHLDLLKTNVTKHQRDKERLRTHLAKFPRQDLLQKSPDNFHWTAPYNLMLDNNKIRLQMWDTENGLLQQEMHEEFKPAADETIFAKYESGRLTVDANSVIVQNF